MCLITDKHITQQRLTEFHPRDKSSWAPALVTAVLWADCCDDIHIQAPVAFHWARCMSKILVGSVFFDSVSLFTSAVIKVLHNNPTDHPRRIVFNPTATQKQLCDFVSQHTKQLFTALNIPQQFLMNSPDTCSTNNDYIVGWWKVGSLKVVNDAAERGVALIQAFNGVLTKRNSSYCKS